MVGTSKPFSPSLHRRNDPRSRKIVKEYFHKKNIPLSDNPDKFGIDLISKDDTLRIEVEHRLIWTTAEFPFADVNVPERKAKFFRENNVGYVILSKDYSHMGMIDAKSLKVFLIDGNLKESSNKYMRQGEYFYKVPKAAFEWVKI